MEAKTIKLSFSAPVHFGDGRLSDSSCSCDAGTLFSALFIEALHMGVAEELLAAAKNGEFALSDAFPYVGDTLYMPKPLLPLAADETVGATNRKPDSRERKAAKKLSVIPLAAFSDYRKGTLGMVDTLAAFRLGKSFLQTKVNLQRENRPEAEPYHVGGFTFEPGSGLYFTVAGTFSIESILDQLQYAGIGGKRTEGFGRFTYTVLDGNPFDQLVPACPNSPRYLLLSTALPKASELTDELVFDARYHMIRKGGFAQSTSPNTVLRKKRDLYLFAAGSTFTQRFVGDVFNVSADEESHPVYRYARALWAEV